MEQGTQWPTHFPPCCPPGDAEDLNGDLFYLAHEPPEDEDYCSAKELGSHPKGDVCERASLSCWITASIPEAITNMPRHRGKAVLRATFHASDGKFKPTGKNAALGHRSTWFCAATHRQLPQRFSP